MSQANNTKSSQSQPIKIWEVPVLSPPAGRRKDLVELLEHLAATASNQPAAIAPLNESANWLALLDQIDPNHDDDQDVNDQDTNNTDNNDDNESSDDADPNTETIRYIVGKIDQLTGEYGRLVRGINTDAHGMFLELRKRLVKLEEEALVRCYTPTPSPSSSTSSQEPKLPLCVAALVKRLRRCVRRVRERVIKSSLTCL